MNDLTDRKINNGIKRVLKQFPQYKRVDSIDQGDIAVILDKKDMEYFTVAYIDSDIKEMITNNRYPFNIVVFLKHKTCRNTKQAVLADITKKKFLKQK